jgi:hypothetical protein
MKTAKEQQIRAKRLTRRVAEQICHKRRLIGSQAVPAAAASAETEAMRTSGKIFTALYDFITL